ncbi:MAG: quinone-dependent dihydroorotate dehydrogenase [Alphaproteobacteria bacterium]|nr:quinone-dependent dihydroorotate dehydrogenase [Alphaproteobacteria bacterium]
MSLYTAVLRPLLFRLDAETVHRASIGLGHALGWSRGLLAPLCAARDPRLATTLAGLPLASPVGLAAGYDKSGEAVRFLSALGFGFLEIGSVSAEPSSGNPRPRLWRLPEDEAIAVHYGLPNDGAAAIAARLADVRLAVPLGINLVKTNRGLDAPPDPDDEIIADYVRSTRLLKDAAGYLTYNLSCPNTETGRDFFADKAHVARLLAALAPLEIGRPVFLKISPLGGVAHIEDVLEAAEPFDFVSGFIFNLPSSKPETLKTPKHVWHNLPGAVSGRPVSALIDARITEMYRRMDRARYQIIGAGGIYSAEDAYAKIRRGASAVQIYTALVYRGPGVVRSINRGLGQLLARDGLAHIGEAVGVDGD